MRRAALILAALVVLAAPPRARPDAAIPVLVYHRFGSVVSDSMTVTTLTFEGQLRVIRERGCRVIPAQRLVAWLKGEESEPVACSVVITVDDGHRSVYTDFWPLVRRYAIPVTLFIYPSAISNASYAMTWAQVQELASSALVDVQSHTFWHPNFTIEKRRLRPKEYERFVDAQLARSRQVLESKLGNRVNLLAWPFGIYDAELTARATALGYVAGFTLERRPARSPDPIMALPRYLITDADRGSRFEAILSGAH